MIKINIEQIWQNFALKYELSSEQLNQFKRYAQLLIEWNNIINLTRIIDIEEIIKYHFEDSLSVINFFDFNKIKTVADIGTGAGFPAIPIKIKYPHLQIILIEVVSKKRNFLNQIINDLNLQNIELYNFDWRTFLRTSSYDVNLFVARASLHTDELIRLFKPGSYYNNSLLVYWASEEWIATEKEKLYLKQEYLYDVGNKKRKLIFFYK